MTNKVIWSSKVEYRGSVKEIDYYGVTFDHLLDDVDGDGDDPEVLQINIIETKYDSAAYANKYSQLQIDPREYSPHAQRVLAVHRCCTTRRGTTDRRRVNECVHAWRMEERTRTGRFTNLTVAPCAAATAC